MGIGLRDVRLHLFKAWSALGLKLYEWQTELMISHAKLRYGLRLRLEKLRWQIIDAKIEALGLAPPKRSKMKRFLRR
jgi:hypothetical protein